MEGSKVLLPVFVRGALFSCGDGHAAQGDGEVVSESARLFTLHLDTSLANAKAVAA